MYSWQLSMMITHLCMSTLGAMEGNRMEVFLETVQCVLHLIAIL